MMMLMMGPFAPNSDGPFEDRKIFNMVALIFEEDPMIRGIISE